MSTTAVQRGARPPRTRAPLLAPMAFAAVAWLAGCAAAPPRDDAAQIRPAQARATIAALLPDGTTDRQGWAVDIYAAFAALSIAPTPDNLCAAIAVTEQESGFRADPSVPGLSVIAWREIDRQADRAGVPSFVARAALRLNSPDGRSYAERIDAAKTERELSEIFEDFTGMVPLGKTLLASRNPVRTGGPMQVSVAFAQAHAADKTYPYPVQRSIRNEVFTRRGGMYFGIAHLLDYPATYERPLYRFADFNAGRWASRNAAFQNAVSRASGIPLVLDGDLLLPGGDTSRQSATELATNVLAERIDMSASAIRRDLERGTEPDFEGTRVFERVFALVQRLEGKALPRAVLPRIDLVSPKITRKLTTAWFAQQVDRRLRRCLARARSADG